MAFKEIWFRGLDAKEKKELENALKYHSIPRKLLEILDQMEKEEQPNIGNYESPAWPYLRADKDGFIRAVNRIKSLLLDQSKET